MTWCTKSGVEVMPAGASLNQARPENKYMTLRPFTHTFTHFKLHIMPLLAQATQKPRQMQEPGSMWLDLEDALQAAIPTPVRTLLGAIQTDVT